MAVNPFFKKIPGILSRERLLPNKKLIIFVIFIGIATFIWLLWTLEKEYTTVISNPVQFSGLPEDRILVNKLPEKIQMEVTARGFAILRHNWDISTPPLKINFSNLYNVPFDNNTAQNINVSLGAAKSRLTNQLSDIRVNSIVPDTLTFSFAILIHKKVPVIADIELEMEKQYMTKGIARVIPDSIEISGPSTILDTLDHLMTAPLRLKKVDRNIVRNLAVVNHHDKITLMHKRVQVEVQVDQYTEKKLEAPIHGINVPDSVQLKFFPATAIITFRVIVSEFEKIQPEQFKLVVDYKQIEAGSAPKLLVQVLNSPDYISNLKTNPEAVSYILENK